MHVGGGFIRKTLQSGEQLSVDCSKISLGERLVKNSMTSSLESLVKLSMGSTRGQQKHNRSLISTVLFENNQVRVEQPLVEVDNHAIQL